MKLDETIKKQITRIRQEIRESNNLKEKSKDKTTIGKQYPSLNKPAKPAPDIRTTLTALSHIRECAISDLFDDDDSINDMNIEEDDNHFFDNLRHANMVSVHGGIWDDEDTIDIQATYRFALKCVHEGKYFGISDGGADSCILGSIAHVINRTKRYARLVGYDPSTTQSERVPIVSAYIKTKDKFGKIVLLLIHEAPYLAHSPTTLLSEYQIREYGKVIDSCAETHVVSSNPRLMGKQRFEVNEEVHIPMVDRGAIMGIEILPYEENDENLYPIHEITSKASWVPVRYRNYNNSDDTSTTVTPESHNTLIAAPLQHMLQLLQ